MSVINMLTLSDSPTEGDLLPSLRENSLSIKYNRLTLRCQGVLRCSCIQHTAYWRARSLHPRSCGERKKEKRSFNPLLFRRLLIQYTYSFFTRLFVIVPVATSKPSFHLLLSRSLCWGRWLPMWTLHTSTTRLMQNDYIHIYMYICIHTYVCIYTHI